MDSRAVRCYPNPATIAVQFALLQPADKSCSIQVYNFIGKKVWESVPGSLNYYLSLDGFNRGVYIYQVRDRFGKVIDSGKFQVVK